MTNRYAAIFLACSSLAGCGSLMESVQGHGGDGVAAEPIAISAPDLARASAADAPLKAKLEFLGGVVFDSEQKCDKFVNRLALSETAVDTSTDIATTAFSALSTAFGAPATKSALSAAATITSGTRTAIDADIYAKAAIADFATAIQKTYYTNIQSYTDRLPTLTDSSGAPLILNNEIAKIQSYHAQCALAPAESAIQAKLGTTSQQDTSTASPPAGAAQENPPKGAPQKSPLFEMKDILNLSGRKPAATRAAVPGSPW